MYFAVMKITFDGGEASGSRKDLMAIVEKIRARHRVCAMPCSTSEDDGEAAIAVTSLANSEESLSRQLDAISKLCEEAGIGRIASERTLLDHLDSFGDDDEDGEGREEETDCEDDSDHHEDDADQDEDPDSGGGSRH